MNGRRKRKVHVTHVTGEGSLGLASVARSAVSS